MITVSTVMPLFAKSAPLRALVTERGWNHEWLADPARHGGIAPEDARAVLLRAAPGITHLIANTIPLDAAFFAAATKLRHVAMFGVGLDHIDMDAATRHGVLVTNVPGGNAQCVAELTFSFMLDLAHKVTRMHTDLAAGLWRPRMGSELAGKTLGIVGLGHIGQTVARLGKAFGMTVIAANRTPRPEIAAQLGIEQCSFGEVLSRADYLTLHVPGGSGSYHLGTAELAAMKQGAFLINTARGDLVDFDALTEALAANRLAGAGTDVFPREPMNPDHPFFRLPNVMYTPHAGGLSRESMQHVAVACLDAIAQSVARRRSANARNP